MGCGNSLIDDEKGMIDAFEKDGHSQREIAQKINRSMCAVNNYIKIGTKHPKIFQVSQKNLSPRNKRAIIRDIRKSGKSVSQIQLTGDITVSNWTTLRTLKNCLNAEFSKGQQAPSWKEHHIKARFSWAKKNISFAEKWSDVFQTRKMEFRCSRWVPLLYFSQFTVELWPVLGIPGRGSVLFFPEIYNG